ncbi:restriction endonuclease subunit S [Pseudomonas sp. V104_10]|uniref:restriction endonuclease subunit S n=1 Tax=Pseudomonas sp. V104_10 TaxID=3044231 RepID=UPI00249E7503|nr:restriction endonuclease subunit S [Pseudomonas sp. V104_10]MDI3368836.1 restriction endonuclease subunit S [Pseudomonas sp. V104_10]
MTFPTYEKYRDSGVEGGGAVPEHWTLGSLKHMAWIRNGRDYKDVESPDGEYPVIGSGGQFANATRYLYDGESVLLGRKGTIDKPLYIHGRFWTVDTMFYTEVALGASAKFLYYNALTIPFQFYSTSTALPSMTQGDLLNHPCAIPPAEEQAQIARFLDHETAHIDALIEEQQRLIELLKEKRQAVISHAVTKGLDPTVPMKSSGVKWLGEVPAHWVCTDLKRFAEVQSGYAFSSEDFTDEGVAVIRIGDIQTDGSVSTEGCKRIVDRDGTYARFSVARGDLLMAMTGATIGKAGWYENDEPAYLNQRVGAFRSSDGLSMHFLAYIIQSHGYQEHIKLTAFGGAQPNISDAGMLSYPSAVPPLEEQIKISKHLEFLLQHVSRVIAGAEQSISLLQERRSALISAAVTGKIDVRDWQPPACAPSPELVQETV